MLGTRLSFEESQRASKMRRETVEANNREIQRLVSAIQRGRGGYRPEAQEVVKGEYRVLWDAAQVGEPIDQAAVNRAIAAELARGANRTEFDRRVDDLVASGMTRSTAQRTMIDADPALYEQHLRAANPSTATPKGTTEEEWADASDGRHPYLIAIEQCARVRGISKIAATDVVLEKRPDLYAHYMAHGASYPRSAKSHSNGEAFMRQYGGGVG